MTSGHAMVLDGYRLSAARRSVRDQEADVFHRVNARLRAAMACATGDAAARAGSAVVEAQALADNGRLWMTVADLMRDPANALPLPLRASILSVGAAVQRESRQAAPDWAFLIGVNEQVAAGLAGR